MTLSGTQSTETEGPSPDQADLETAAPPLGARLSRAVRVSSRWVVANALLLALLGSYVAMAYGVATLSHWFFAIGIIVSYGVDLALPYVKSNALSLLRKNRFGLTMRFLVRQLLLIGFFGEFPGFPRHATAILACGFIYLFVFLVLYGLPLETAKRKHRTIPATVRTLDLSEATPPPLPRNLVYRSYVRKILYLDVLISAGATASIVTDQVTFLYGGIGALVLVSFIAMAVMLPQAARAHRVPEREDSLAAVNRALGYAGPEVVVYFSFASATSDFMYQVNMWLPVLKSTRRSCLVVLRERRSMELLAPTDIPAICVPKADDLGEIELPHARVVLYPGNAGKNVHMLGRAEMKHVFVGHGDSDKLASSNRVSKTYDEIWVAGQAGRERYRRLRGSISDEAIVEVGLPQLDEVEPAAPQAKEHPAVLYAPTWEGWTREGDYSSVPDLGVRIITELLRLNPEGRIVYRPHPMLGYRSPEAAEEHRKILAILEEDNKRRLAEDPGLVADATVLKEMAALEERMAELQDRSRDSPAYHLTEQERVVRQEFAISRWYELFPMVNSPRLHFHSTGRLPGLFAVFNAVDGMISDISSVVSDFLASGKPYALSNPRDLSVAELTEQVSVAGAAYLVPVGEDLAVGDFLEAVRAAGDDRLAERRRILRTFVLGGPEAQKRFTYAVDDLYERGIRTFPAGEVPVPTVATPFNQEDTEQEDVPPEIQEEIPPDIQEEIESMPTATREGDLGNG
ncbi:hypothetical protein ACIRJS_41210 [Streptomyces sp. NPDC102340]|uniref:hypothetical protein n=1 Tax=unclassified Streptomyces TaxID=2593676 RepID=UPI003810C1F9